MTDSNRVVVFRVAQEHFAVHAAAVDEAVTDVAIVRLPGLPRHSPGVVRHRGHWLPAVDPAPALGLPAADTRDAALIVRRGPVRYALLADDVLSARGSGGEVMELDGHGLVAMVDFEDLFSGEFPADWEEDTMTSVEVTTSPTSLVAFRLASDEFAMDVGQVQEVLPYDAPKPVPRLPAFVEGVLEIRGGVVPVIDLRTRFEIEARAPNSDTRILVVGLDEDRIGLVVDAVTDVLRLPAEAVSAAPAYFRGLSADFLEGLARSGDRLLIVLRMDRILTSAERLQLRGAEEAEAAPEAVADRPKKARGAAKRSSSKAKPKARANAQTEAEAKPRAEQKSKGKPKSKAETTAKAEVKAKPKRETKTEAKPEAEPTAKAETKRKSGGKRKEPLDG